MPFFDLKRESCRAFYTKIDTRDRKSLLIRKFFARINFHINLKLWILIERIESFSNFNTWGKDHTIVKLTLKLHIA